MSKEIKTTLPAKNSTSIVAARGVSDDASLAQYIQNVQKIPVLTAEQEYEYATKWVQNQDKFAAEKLVASHLRLVVSVARSPPRRHPRYAARPHWETHSTPPR